MKARFQFVAVYPALLFLAAPIADSAEGSSTLTTACGSTVKNTCRGRCYLEYENFICKNPKPGEVGKHKKELQECYKSCEPKREPYYKPPL